MLGNIGIFLMVIAGMCLIYEVACLCAFGTKDKVVLAIFLISSIGGIILAPLRPKILTQKITAQKRKDSDNEYDISIWYQKNSRLIKTINLDNVTELRSTSDFTLDTITSMIDDNLCLSVEVNSKSFDILAVLCQIDVRGGEKPILQKESERFGIIWRAGINSDELKNNNIKFFKFRFLVLAEDKEKRIIERFSKWFGYFIDSKMVLS